MFRRILIPTDFSPAAYQATQMGMELCKQYDTEVHILHIYPETTKFSRNQNTELPERAKEMELKMNELSGAVLNGHAQKVKNQVITGNIEHTMLDFIDSNDFDLVIVGVNSNGDDNHMGSHTASLIQKSDTPVMIVPNRSLDAVG